MWPAFLLPEKRGEEVLAEFQKRIRSFIDRHQLLEPGMKVVVAVSGGSDSLALLHVLKELRDSYQWELHVAHLNHLLRPAAGEEAAFVQGLAHRWGLPVTIGYCRVTQLASRWKVGIEEAARIARYHFLLQVARSVGAQRIAVGHHADDQVETVLFNIIRGTGPAGLAGIPWRNGPIVRPLLGVTRQEIESYCRQAGLSWCTDLSNLDTTYFRNKIRHLLLPLLKREFNPEINQAVLRLADIMEQENRFMSKYAQRLFRRLARKRGLREVEFSLPGFQQLPQAFQRRLLRIAVKTVGGSLRDLGYRHVEESLEFISNPVSFGELHLPKGVRLQKDRGVVRVCCLQGAFRGELSKDFFQELQVPGETYLPELGLVFRAEVKERWEMGELVFTRERDNYQVFFDYDKIELPLYVRNWRPGDRIKLLGLGGSKKIKKLFSDLKIPRQERWKVPLVASKETVFWVVGYRRSEEAKITSETKRILVLSVVRCEKS
ncbi:MAG TPA: tRNA lysidine(34) synthetase TilS [Peptococcaceae bacterium]|nr:tRNA lysidine(34) synthetase TilS [Peptococcaceae bacterium]